MGIIGNSNAIFKLQLIFYINKKQDLTLCVKSCFLFLLRFKNKFETIPYINEEVFDSSKETICK